MNSSKKLIMLSFYFSIITLKIISSHSYRKWCEIKKKKPWNLFSSDESGTTESGLYWLEVGTTSSLFLSFLVSMSSMRVGVDSWRGRSHWQVTSVPTVVCRSLWRSLNDHRLNSSAAICLQPWSSLQKN